MTPDRRLQIAERIRLLLTAELGTRIDVGRLLSDPRYARDVLWVCDAYPGRELARLAAELRSLLAQVPSAARAPSTPPAPARSADAPVSAWPPPSAWPGGDSLPIPGSEPLAAGPSLPASEFDSDAIAGGAPTHRPRAGLWARAARWLARR
jgi:hypothetical protein